MNSLTLSSFTAHLRPGGLQPLPLKVIKLSAFLATSKYSGKFDATEPTSRGLHIWCYNRSLEDPSGLPVG